VKRTDDGEMGGAGAPQGDMDVAPPEAAACPVTSLSRPKSEAVR
jgi:hypothetical protein